MAGDELAVLLVEDNPGDARLIEEMLQAGEGLLERVELGGAATRDWQLHHEQRLAGGLERVAGGDADVVLLDLALPDSEGLETVTTALEAAPSVPIVVLTGLRDEELGLEAIQRGAQDYLVKDEVTSDLLVRSIHHALERNRQERERARRREQLEALNTLTRELMDAETPAEVSEYVIEAAPTMLDLPATVLALYDEAEGALRPTGYTREGADRLDPESLLSVGDSPGWQAFTTGEVVRVTPPDGGETPPDGAAVAELAAVPLARHGVFVTGATDPDGFSPTDFDLVETVAANLEATLDRVERERTLHEREETLEEQNRTLERLSRVNDIIRNIARALVEAGTREEIEVVVCEQLAGVGPYELAWIGGYDPGTGELAPRHWAGTERGFLEDLVEAESAPSGDGPFDLAVTTGEPQVVDDVLDDDAVEPWRRPALNRGLHATTTLPLRYDDAEYGVLTVYAGQPGVFDDLELAVLAELADTIAYAIDAVESRHALVSDEVRRLEFSVADATLPALDLSRTHDCTFSVVTLVPRADGGTRAFFATEGVRPAAVLELESRLPVAGLELVSETDGNGGGACLFEADLTDESLAATVPALGGRLRALQVEDGVATIAVELAGTDVAEFVEAFTTRFPAADLVAQRTRERSRRSPAEVRDALTGSLTGRQLEAVQTAYFSSFFDRPRERSGRDVAASMGISQPTFNTHLREAQRKLCRAIFEEGWVAE